MEKHIIGDVSKIRMGSDEIRLIYGGVWSRMCFGLTYV